MVQHTNMNKRANSFVTDSTNVAPALMIGCNGISEVELKLARTVHICILLLGTKEHKIPWQVFIILCYPLYFIPSNDITTISRCVAKPPCFHMPLENSSAWLTDNLTHFIIMSAMIDHWYLPTVSCDHLTLHFNKYTRVEKFWPSVKASNRNNYVMRSLPPVICLLSPSHWKRQNIILPQVPTSEIQIPSCPLSSRS